MGWWPSLQPGIGATILWLGLPLAGGVAIYTAFLFGQAEGRDLWQSSLLPFHLLVQAFMAGSGMMWLVLAISENILIVRTFTQLLPTVYGCFAISIFLDLLITFSGEFGMSHASGDAALAAYDIKHGRYKKFFWTGSVILGHIVPLALLVLGWATFSVMSTGTLAGIFVMLGLYCYEYAFVMAPQDIPNS
jgi:formate-dependent nitrite reductase membrane component NrfD